MLINSDFPPGKKIHVESVVQLIGAGRTPVREALFQLCAENIVEFQYQKGFYAAEISLNDLNDLVAIKNNIERILITESLKNGNDEWEDGLILSHHRLKKWQAFNPTEDYSANREWIENHRKFHASLVSGASNSRALKIYNMIEQNLDRYRSFSFRYCNDVAKNDAHKTLFKKIEKVSSQNEHDVIYNLALERRTDELCKFLHNHNIQTLDIYKNYITNSEYFLSRNSSVQ